jgi:Lon protease-like protein
MQTNRSHSAPEDLPASVPVFPLTAALLLPRGTLPLNIFEPRYLAMIDDALKGARMIGMVQPRTALSEHVPAESPEGTPPLCDIGCLGRITCFQETGDGRYLITLKGVARFRVSEELETVTPYRQCAIDTVPFAADLAPCCAAEKVDRERLLGTLRAYLDANEMEADWPSVVEASTETLVNALSMMCPYGPREKQALLEADDLQARADMLIAMTEMVLHRTEGKTSGKLQ